MWASIGQTLVAAAVGAFAANFIAELVKGQVRRSQSQESARDDDLATMLRMVEELQGLATDYWTESGGDLGAREPILRARIVARQQHVLELIAHLFSDDPKRECDVLITKLLHAVGGGDFGDPDRPAEPERLTAVYQHSLAFIHLAKKCRRGLKRGILA